MRSSAVPDVIRFGLFELDLNAMQLRRRGVKVHLQEQPLKVLILLVQRPGQIVERDEFRQALWAADTFVEFDDGLSKAVQKLRYALGDSSNNARFVETVPRKGYRFIAPVEAVADGPGQPDTAPRATQPAKRRFFRASALLAIPLAAAAIFTSSRLSPRAADVPLRMIQLTTDTSLTYEPALSAGGELLAYASDRGSQGSLDIWVQQIPRSEPIRVTHDGADDHEPAFSPDARSIVFRSERDGGGIYVVPALGGGQARRIADGGRRPRYSPDGATIAYWTGQQHRFGNLYVVRASGGTPSRLNIDGMVARSPAWTSDGKHLVFHGYRPSADECDWYVVPVEGGPIVRTGAVQATRRYGLSALELPNPYPEVCLKDRNEILFSAKLGDSFELWKLSFDRRWQVAGEPQRVAGGSGFYRYASVADNGRIAFASLMRNADVWALPVNAERGSVAGGLQRLTQGAADDLSPSISGDGRRLVFESNRTGKRVVWAKDLETGREHALSDAPSTENLPVITADGSEVVYKLQERQHGSPARMFTVSFEGGPARKVCETGCQQPLQWSSDNRHILYAGADAVDAYVGMVDARTGQSSRLLHHPRYWFWSGVLSPDERWMTFATTSLPGTIPRSYRARVRDGKVDGEASWMPAPVGGHWSPGGAFLYFFSAADGFMCLYSQRIDGSTGRTVGEPRALHHFHNATLIPIDDPAWRGGGVARDKVVITLVESAGNIWLADKQ